MSSPLVAEALEEVAHPLSAGASSTGFFPFMQLPAELRLQIYHLMLPSQDEPSKSSAWSVGPKGCMNLLLSNRKIWSEAREVVYKHSAFTVDISTSSALKFLALNTSPKDHLPFEVIRPTASIDHIKDWQIELRFYAPYVSFTLPVGANWFSRIHGDEVYMGERILEATGQLAKIRDLRSLKIKFPCVCYGQAAFGILYDPVGRISRSIHYFLEPLKCLRFHGSVRFIAARPDSSSLHRPPVRMFDEQCQEPDCLAFIAQFRDLETSLRGPSSSVPQLPVQQRKWLEIKRRVGTLDNSLYHMMLQRLWTYTDAYRGTFVEETFFARITRRRQFKKAYGIIQSQLDTIPQLACERSDTGLDLEDWDIGFDR
ncbi:MAG: hypothetical protein L6R36_000022 [Xanthoria steineri]|nr:MAG: hypothetical protein L6R36_000022 [Xanthoria steineri]